MGVLTLRLRIMNLLLGYEKITVRMVFYRLISLYSEYPNNRAFYKRMGYSLKRLRKSFPDVHEKFEDPSRPLRSPKIPSLKVGIELWVEKSSLAFLLRRLAAKYNTPLLAERGFGSLSMFRRAVNRAARRRVKKILLISDFDPSGLEINLFTDREMPVEVERVALTLGQIERYRLNPIKVKRSDSRAAQYIQKYGDRGWEVEALPPTVLFRIIEKALRRNIPQEVLEELRLREETERVTKPLEKHFVEAIRGRALELKKLGFSDKEVRKKLAGEFGLGTK